MGASDHINDHVFNDGVIRKTVTLSIHQCSNHGVCIHWFEESYAERRQQNRVAYVGVKSPYLKIVKAGEWGTQRSCEGRGRYTDTRNNGFAIYM